MYNLRKTFTSYNSYKSHEATTEEEYCTLTKSSAASLAADSPNTTTSGIAVVSGVRGEIAGISWREEV
jgi:hypothetical protein